MPMNPFQVTSSMAGEAQAKFDWWMSFELDIVCICFFYGYIHNMLVVGNFEVFYIWQNSSTYICICSMFSHLNCRPKFILEFVQRNLVNLHNCSNFIQYLLLILECHCSLFTSIQSYAEWIFESQINAMHSIKLLLLCNLKKISKSAYEIINFIRENHWHRTHFQWHSSELNID